jgi:lipopolysaccharide transport system ATP-binding protein
MSDIAITVEGLSKRYVIHHQRPSGGGLRHALQDKLAAPFRWLRPSKESKMQTGAGGSQSATEDFWALKDVSFEVKRGEVVGIIGRNGAGKSTLLKILSRITEPTTGRITIEGRVASLLEVGTGFHAELTGRENIFLNGSILGMRRAEIMAKFDEIVAFAEIDRFLDTPVKRYSSGMYVRLAFAVAAHLEPEILVVDEVLAVGDTQFQQKCIGKMQDVSRGGRTVLFVSHNMGAVQKLCSSGLVLHQGAVQFQGSSDEALSHYSQVGAGDLGTIWSRQDGLSSPPIAFHEIRVALIGTQPNLKLDCDITLECSKIGSPVFIALDICDQSSMPLMQAIPRARAFISPTIGRLQLSVEVDLPPLIPGLYIVDFWIGADYSSTTDYIKRAVSFEVTESPPPERYWPYSRDHGFMVPVSRCRVRA